MKIIVNGKATGEIVKDTVELLAFDYFLYGEEKVVITLEEE